MKIVPHSDTRFAVKDATKHNHILKDKFHATFKEGNVYGWLVEMELLEDLIAEFTDVSYDESHFNVDWHIIERIVDKRNMERAANLLDTLTRGGYVIINSGARLKVWGPGQDTEVGQVIAKDLDAKLKDLAEYVLHVAEYGFEKRMIEYSDTDEFIPRDASATLSDVHWEGISK